MNRYHLLLPALALASISLAAAPKRPFSHKYHLTQVASCESCHTTAAESTKAEDDLIPDKGACVTCHDEVEIAPARAAGVQKFNHSVHVAKGNPAPHIAAAVASKQYLGAHPPSDAQLAAAKDACTGCHHGIPESENVPHDKLAKAHFPQMADCLVCHNKINPPESCKQCHVESKPKFRPESHVTGFLDSHSAKTVDKTTCAGCHGRKVACKDCH